MHIAELTTDAAVLSELGRRLTRHRLERNWTQAQLAVEAGVGQATVQRAERGQSVQMTSMIKLLRTLELLGGLDAAIPESIDLPIAQLERQQRKLRRRAAGRHRAPMGRGRQAGGRGAGSNEQPRGQGDEGDEAGERRWSWGDEPDGDA